MKIFIAGARSIKSLDYPVQQKLLSIYHKGFDVLIGDCYGVDTAVQSFFAALNSSKVTVYASNGRARNNIGRWNVETVHVPQGYKGFDYYKQKDIAMANCADYGFMIWDGESKGTLNNIINLLAQNKKVLVYLSLQQCMYVIKSVEELSAFISSYAPKALPIYSQLTQEFAQQLSLAI